MKKILLGAAALSLLFAASCKKSDDGGSSNNWTLNGATHAVKASSASGFLLGFVDDASVTSTSYNEAMFAFGGASLPTASGSYKIVADAVNSDEVSITAGSETATSSTTYSSRGFDNVKATVTVSNGKVTIIVPSVWVKNDNGTDSVKFSGNLTQL